MTGDEAKLVLSQLSRLERLIDAAFIVTGIAICILFIYLLGRLRTYIRIRQVRSEQLFTTEEMYNMRIRITEGDIKLDDITQIMRIRKAELENKVRSSGDYLWGSSIVPVVVLVVAMPLYSYLTRPIEEKRKQAITVLSETFDDQVNNAPQLDSLILDLKDVPAEVRRPILDRMRDDAIKNPAGRSASAIFNTLRDPSHWYYEQAIEMAYEINKPRIKLFAAEIVEKLRKAQKVQHQSRPSGNCIQMKGDTFELDMFQSLSPGEIEVKLRSIRCIIFVRENRKQVGNYEPCDVGPAWRIDYEVSILDVPYNIITAQKYFQGSSPPSRSILCGGSGDPPRQSEIDFWIKGLPGG